MTTARLESFRVLRRAGRGLPPVEDSVLERTDDADPVDMRLLVDERNRALWAAYRQLPEKCRRLLQVAVYEPQAYDEISAILGMPVGSIGPTRRRCLTQLRALLDGSVVAPEGGTDPGEAT